nr:MAG TPA: hypothetical protein [Caudoviricetes sp.]
MCKCGLNFYIVNFACFFALCDATAFYLLQKHFVSQSFFVI